MTNAGLLKCIKWSDIVWLSAVFCAVFILVSDWLYFKGLLFSISPVIFVELRFLIWYSFAACWCKTHLYSVLVV